MIYNTIKANNNMMNEINKVPYISNFNKQLIKIYDESYTATEDCMVFVITITNSTAFSTITTTINGVYYRQYQCPVAQENIVDAFTVALKAGDTLNVSGAKSYTFIVRVHTQ